MENKIPKKENRSPALKLAGGLLAVGVLIAIAKMLPVQDWLESFNFRVKDLGYWGYIVFIAMYVFATVLFLPGSVLTLGAGFAFGVFGGFIAVSLGSTSGAAFAFLIARYIARDAVARKLSKSDKFSAIDSAIGKEGGKLVLLLRLSPVFPFNALNYLLGLTAVPFRDYVLASWVGMIPGTLLYVYLGYIGKAGLEAASGAGGKSPLEYLFLGLGLILTVVVTVYVTRLARNAVRGREAEVSPLEAA